MMVRIITHPNGEIIAFRVNRSDHDPKVHGEIFPTGGDIAHDVEVPVVHQDLFRNRPGKVCETLSVEIVDGKPRLSNR
jgi:hypothetical protein